MFMLRFYFKYSFVFAKVVNYNYGSITLKFLGHSLSGRPQSFIRCVNNETRILNKKRGGKMMKDRSALWLKQVANTNTFTK